MVGIKRILSFILRVSVSIGLLIFLFRRVDLDSLALAIKKDDKIILLVAFFILFLEHVLAFLRWQMLIKAYAIAVSSARLAVSYAVCIFFNALLPSAVGGDLARAFDLANFAKKSRQVIATVILDRLSGYAGVVAVILPAVFFGFRLFEGSIIILPVAGMVVTFIVIVLLLFNDFIFSKVNRFLGLLKLGRFFQSLKDLHQDLHDLGLRKRVIASNVAISVVIQLIMPLIFYMVALALGVKVNILYFFVYIPLVGAITLLPVSIGGLGLRDAAIVFLFIRLGVAKDLALAMSLIFFFFTFIYAAIGGLVYVFNLRARRV